MLTFAQRRLRRVHLSIQKYNEDRLLQAVKDLGEPDSQILYRRYFMQQSVKEIAETLGMKSNSVSKRITRALSALEERLGESGHD